jgi:hypothetical protein
MPVCEIDERSSVMTDLGFDSISIVKLACGIEGALGVPELALTRWIAVESDPTDERFTVQSFLALVLTTMQTGAG